MKKNKMKKIKIINEIEGFDTYNKILEEYKKQQKEISDNEIKSKDRVDISREEYEKMKNEIKELNETCNHQNQILKNLGLSNYIKGIDLKTLTISSYDMPEKLCKKIMIIFDFKESL